MKTVQKRVFWHDEHLRLLQMPIFAFLEQISKIDNENSAKTRFSACWTLANTAHSFICVPRVDFKSWWWKQCKIALFGMLNICDYCICLYLRFLNSFQKLMMKTLQNQVFFGMLNSSDYCICLYLRFRSKFQKMIIKTLQKRGFSACWTFATSAYAFICVSSVDLKSW